jgi:RNA polymerase sigma factor (sigma-70 family)
MLKPHPIISGHEELFIERYDRLLTWSLQFTNYDRGLAEDLVHDAFIQFTFTHPDLNAINNLDNYLYGMLRNLHLSQVRWVTRSRFQQLSIAEYDSAEIGLRAADIRDQIQAQDELRRICHYACARKETARAASVLILRFFHGYYPSEIAQILRSSRQAVSIRLRLARAEAKASIEDPKSLSFMGESPFVKVPPTVFARSIIDLLAELRQTIFQSRRGPCLSKEKIQEFYRMPEPAQLERAQLAHIVSCSDCIEEVNRALELPSLSERNAIDTIGPDTRSKGGPPKGGGTADGGAGSIQRARQRAKETFEHEPNELYISVNGIVQGSQKINSEYSELNLVIDLAETIRFIEIRSEQGMRLLLLNVGGQPPSGPAEQSVEVELSDGRTLESTLRFMSPSPTLSVLYHDPAFKETWAVNIEAIESRPAASRPTVSSQDTKEGSGQTAAGQRFGAQAAKLWRTFASWSFWLRPGTVAAAFGLILVSALLLMQLRRTPVATMTATDLLKKSIAAENALTSRPGIVLHSMINFEENGSGSKPTVRRRIEVWQNTEKGITARRLYDERGALLAGDWRRADGVQMLYRPGAPPKLQLAPEKGGNISLDFDNVWQLSLSAKDFAALVNGASQAHVEERSSEIVINYTDLASDGSHALRKAVLIMSRADLHVIEQVLLVQHGGEVREYRFKESNFNQLPASQAPQSVFQPEPELIGQNGRGAELKSRSETLNALTPFSVEAETAPPTVASADLEVEVAYLLHQIKADLGEQISVTRTREGQLQLEGLVETEERKADIVRALLPVIDNPALKVRIETVAEAMKRQNRTRTSSVTIGSGEVNATKIAVDEELRSYFTRLGVSNEKIDEEIRQFSGRIISRSNQAMRHAGALKRLIRQLMGKDMQALGTEARARRLSILREHVLGFQREIATLGRELQTVFPSGPIKDSTAGQAINSEAELVQAVDHLFDLGSTTDAAIRQAFTISESSSSFPVVKTEGFWLRVRSSEKLAQEILDALPRVNTTNQ